MACGSCLATLLLQNYTTKYHWLAQLNGLLILLARSPSPPCRQPAHHGVESVGIRHVDDLNVCVYSISEWGHHGNLGYTYVLLVESSSAQVLAASVRVSLSERRFASSCIIYKVKICMYVYMYVLNGILHTIN